MLPRRRARGPRRDPSRGVVPAARRARAACGHSRCARNHSRCARRSGSRRADDRAVRAGVPRRARFRPRSFGLRGDRRDRDLIYVSPRSGRAVSRVAGEAYRDRLLRLPAFLRTENASISDADLADAFALTGFFLDRHAFSPRGLPLPDARARFVAAVLVHKGQPR